MPVRLADTIDAIYDAAVDPGAWRRLPEVIARTLDGETGFLWIADAEGGLETFTFGLSEDALRQYADHFHRIDPWRQAAWARGPCFDVALGADLVPELRFRQTEFYADFARGFDTVDVVGAHLALGPGRVAGIGTHRPRGVGRFETRHARRLKALHPHLQRAAQLRDRLAGADRAGAGHAVLDALAIGAVVCDRAGGVLFANRAAEAMAAGDAGIVLGGAANGLGAVHADEARALALLVADAARGARAERRSSAGGAAAACSRWSRRCRRASGTSRDARSSRYARPPRRRASTPPC